MQKNTKSRFCKSFSNILENTGNILTDLWLFFKVPAPFLKTDVVLTNLKQIGNFPLTTDSLKLFITFTGMSVACMAAEISNTLISLRASSIVIILKEKHF